MRKNIIVLFFILFILLTTSTSTLAKVADIDTVAEIKDILWNYYLDRPPYALLKQKTINDVLETLDDPYTKYYNEQEFRDFWLSVEGKVAGIGVAIEKSNGKVTVTKVISSTPAARAQIQKGDIITQVNGIYLNYLSMEEITQLFSGKPGTYLRLETFRPKTATFFNYLLIREYIKIDPVESTTLAPDIGYIKINEFTPEASKNFSTQLNKLNNLNIEGLIIDLRDNPGGLIGSALDIASELLPPGPFVQLIYRGKEPEVVSTVGTLQNLPLIVLVNENTASSAEILAGAIQDRDAGIVLGTQTYGKASVQSVIPLVKGGALRFTSGKYLTPQGQEINKIGLKPDLYISAPQEQVIEAVWLLNNQVHQGIIFQLANKTFMIKGNNRNLPIKPFLYKNNFMLPLRSTIESLGGQVTYYPPDKLKINLKNKQITLRLNSDIMTYQGHTQHLPVKVLLKNGTTLVPIRPLAQLFDMQVEWRAKTGQVLLLPHS